MVGPFGAGLPDPLHAVAVKRFVSADNRQLLDQGLRED